MLDVALRAQARGFSIFPVAPSFKEPHRLSGYRDGAGQYHGWGETATNDLAQIIHFWTKVDPQANVGIACKPSRLLVVDLDKPKEPWKLKGTEWEYLHGGYGPYVSGDDLFEEMVWKLAGGVWPSTYIVRTGSGGKHLYFRWPSFWPQTSQASPAKGVIDVRGNGGQWGGYVLAEGCVTEAGKYEALEVTEPALAPDWIRQMVIERPKIQAPRRVSGIRQPSAVSWSGLVRTVREAGEGNRNNALLYCARAMCSDGATQEEATDTLGPAAQDAGLGWFEIERTIASGYNAQRRKEGL